MSSWEPGGVRLSAFTPKFLESFQGQERGRGSIGTLWASSAGKLLAVACAADRQLDILRRCGKAQLRFIFSDDLKAAGVFLVGQLCCGLRRSCAPAGAGLPWECFN